MLIHFQRTFNVSQVMSIMTHSRLYPHLTHDGHPSPKEFQPNMAETIQYMLALNEADEVMGLVITHPILCPTTWEVHHAILPQFWRYTDAIGDAFETWLFSETICQTAVGFTPACNKLALRYARKHMTETGIIPRSYLKNNTLYDIHIFSKHKNDI